MTRVSKWQKAGFCPATNDYSNVVDFKLAHAKQTRRLLHCWLVNALIGLSIVSLIGVMGVIIHLLVGLFA